MNEQKHKKSQIRITNEKSRKGLGEGRTAHSASGEVSSRGDVKARP